MAEFYNASKSQLDRAALKVVEAHEEIEGMRQAVIMTGETLARTWRGGAAASFGQAMIGWDDNMKIVLNDLFRVSETLGANAQVYQRVDDEQKGANFIQSQINDH
ncbi:WXG100 family type VII secretion target [Nonomuraea sp. NPDC059194]|uniref:WXG100 family type VII secretion target n=1 Tax=Nonomuraea sp. NPDC059194 TaxID=3346764 RepID=UPI0036836BAF